MEYFAVLSLWRLFVNHMIPWLTYSLSSSAKAHQITTEKQTTMSSGAWPSPPPEETPPPSYEF
ncbi:hypothetical protein SADUNF_Sadunf14G0011400 [Salix dunnii]|uniref:Uncharacterized protein n=1 Tax=Salix dunnii TaxID=1413687 RepID=A0A835MT08_9ROSI|nr:hypothetical protein SADUNF_Sadunf14G0011400 [Salix dunnii]